MYSATDSLTQDARFPRVNEDADWVPLNSHAKPRTPDVSTDDPIGASKTMVEKVVTLQLVFKVNSELR